MALKIPKEIKVSVVMIIAIGMLVWGLGFLRGSGFFYDHDKYYVVYRDIDGLTESGAIMLNGLKIGTVSSIQYNFKQSGILVEIVIENTFRLPKYTRAEIYSADLMGTKAIRLDFGCGPEYHPSGDTLNPGIEESLQDRVGAQMLPIKIKAEELMKELTDVIEVIKYVFNEDTRENLSKSFLSIKKTLNNLEHSSLSLDTLLTSNQGRIKRILMNIESISSNLRNNNDKLALIINNFATISDSLAKSEITSTINNADAALRQANEVIEKINRGEGTIGLLLHNDTLYDNLAMAAKDLDNLLLDLKNNPKKYIHYSLFDFGRTFYVLEDEAVTLEQETKNKRIKELSKKIKKCKKSPDNCTQEELDSMEKELELLQKNNTSGYIQPDPGDQRIFFSVQLKSATKPISTGSPEFKGRTDVKELHIGTWYKYAVGEENSLKAATELQQQLRNEFPDAFVIAVKGNSLISIKQASRELGS